ncbi:MAG: 2-oxoacid:acceptor oxidoreductase family protein [Myxococcales bacterium]
MYEAAPLAARLAREFRTPVAVLASGILCHSEGLVSLGPVAKVPRLKVAQDFRRFMNLPAIAKASYRSIVTERLAGLTAFAERAPLNRVEWHDRSLGVVVHGACELHLRDVWEALPVRPSVLSLGMTYPLPRELLKRFAAGLSGPIVVLGDGLRFVEEELRAMGLAVQAREEADPSTEWTPETVGRHLGLKERPARARSASTPAALQRPPEICAGCPYRAFGLAVQKLRKQGRVLTSFGDIGCNTLLYFLDAIDSCTCMGASDGERQGAVLAEPSLAPKVLSVLGDSTECHSGLDATRNAVFRGVPGVKVVLDNRLTAMTGGQPAPSSGRNLQGAPVKFDLVRALEAEGASVVVVDAFDLKAIEKTLVEALEGAAKGAFTVVVVRGQCIQEVPGAERVARYAIAEEACKKCNLCLICPGIEKDERGYPRFTSLCSGCGGEEGTCVQRCHSDAIVERAAAAKGAEPRGVLPPLPAFEAPPSVERVPAIRVAIRGVGGQGNLFLGKVLAEVARQAGYGRILKGETHGMAQLGGAVESSFGCGEVFSPVFAPGTVDVLVALEESELLRPGFLELLKPSGRVALSRTRILPSRAKAEQYPAHDAVRAALEGVEVAELDALAVAQSLGDPAGRTSNVVMLGALSTLEPLKSFPLALWQRALVDCSPSETSARVNLAAFQSGRDAVYRR